MFGTILIVIGTLLNVYVFWRAATVPFVRRHALRRIVIGSGVVLWAGFVLSNVLRHGRTGAVVELFGMTWLATLFLISVCLLAADLVTGFGFFLRRLAPSLRGWALATGVGLSVIALVQGLRPPVVERYEVQLDGLPAELDGTVLVALSDLHLGSLLGERWLDARVSQVQALAPDVIVLLGDLTEGHGESPDRFLAGLRRLSAPLGVWAVPGNHESHRGGDDTLPGIEGDHLQMLRNRWVEIRRGLTLAGVDDLTSARRRGRGSEFVAQALAGRPAGATILLSHTPWQTASAARSGVGLMLSGHTHGGQIWPLGYLTRTRYLMLDGRRQVGDMSVIICRGTGTWGPRMRLWSPGEILHVTLRARDA